MLVRLVLAAWLVGGALGATSAAAQEPGRNPSEAEVEEARALFMAGEAAVDSGRWADAVESFSRAYELSGVAAALYNVAYALRSLGRHVESRDAFRRLFSQHPDMAPELRQEAERYLEEEEARIAVVELSGLDADTRYTVRLDGARRADSGDRPLRLEADPGTHTVMVRTPETEPFVWEGELADGARRDIEVELAPIGSEGGGGGSGGAGSGTVDGGGGLTSSPWFWLAVGVVVVGAGAGAAYLLHDGAQLDPMSNRVYEL